MATEIRNLTENLTRTINALRILHEVTSLPPELADAEDGIRTSIKSLASSYRAIERVLNRIECETSERG